MICFGRQCSPRSLTITHPCFLFRSTAAPSLQHESDAADPAELDALAAKETVLKDSLAEVKSKNSRLSESIRALANEPSDADLAVQLASYKKQVDALNARLARIKGDGKQVSKADMDKVQAKFNDAARAWVKRKRATNDMIAEFCGDEGDPKQLIVSAGRRGHAWVGAWQCSGRFGRLDCSC